MALYYVNTKAQTNGDHEVHQYGCTYFPAQEHAQYLGQFSICQYAVAEAKKYYPLTANGCFYCANTCHTR